MVVYWEYAFLENALLDGVLLYLAEVCARAKVSVWRLLVAAAVGGAEAVLFPLLSLPAAAAYAAKMFGGALLVVLATKGRRWRPYAVAAAAFFFLTFALGGLLTAVWSFFGVETAEGNGYLVEQAPVGLVLGGAGLFAILTVAAARAFYRHRRRRRSLLDCRLAAGERAVRWRGFADSGNLLTFRGKPVCVVSPAAAFALFGRNLKEAGRITVGTVNGGREAPVFACDRLEIETGSGTLVREDVYLTVGDVRSKDYQLVLHAALTEAGD